MDDMTLVALLKGEAPAQDWRFILAVMARIEKRRFHVSLARNILFGLGAMALLELCAPALASAWRDLSAPLSSDVVVGGLLLAGAMLALPWLARQD